MLSLLLPLLLSLLLPLLLSLLLPHTTLSLTALSLSLTTQILLQLLK